MLQRLRVGEVVCLGFWHRDVRTTPVAGGQSAPVTGFTERANGMPTHTAVLTGYTRVGWAPPPVVSPISSARPSTCSV